MPDRGMLRNQCLRNFQVIQTLRMIVTVLGMLSLMVAFVVLLFSVALSLMVAEYVIPVVPILLFFCLIRESCPKTLFLFFSAQLFPAVFFPVPSALQNNGLLLRVTVFHFLFFLLRFLSKPSIITVLFRLNLIFQQSRSKLRLQEQLLKHRIRSC